MGQWHISSDVYKRQAQGRLLMKADFDAVAFQRRVRKKLSEEYCLDSKKFRSRLKKLKLDQVLKRDRSVSK